MGAPTPGLLGQLLDFSFKGVSFPATSFRLSLRHDLAQHKFADKDGAEIEATGRAPIQISARIPFVNGLDRGPNESWEDPLYPTVYRKFFDACADRSTGVVNHPEFGPIRCKTEHVETVWDATHSGGVEVDVVWIETIDDQSLAGDFVSPFSPTAALADAAASVDTNLTYASPTVPELPKFGASFQDLVNTVRGVASIPDLLSMQIGGKIAALQSQADTLQESIDKANNVVNWPLAQAVQIIRASTQGLRDQLLAKRRDIGFWYTQADKTLAAIAADIGAPLGDVFELNAQLLERPIVPAHTTVRYYAS